MNYTEALDFLYHQLPMFQRQGKKAFKKDLRNILKLCEALGNPHLQLKCIHIAGTNGKGSVSNLVAGMLQKTGLKIGLYTSPHYKDFRERIRINGKKISKKFVVEFVQKVKMLSLEIKPSFFEISVAMAFEYFNSRKVEYAVIETGLGGRLDSTNIITPLLSVITNIGYDHQAFLGETLDQIANEKAGIIKNFVPIIIGEHQKEVIHVFHSHAKSKNAPLTLAENEIQVSEKGDSISFRLASGKLVKVNSVLRSPFFESNVCTSLAAIDLLAELEGIDLNEEQLEWAIDNLPSLTSYMGRWQILSKAPLTLADSAHNLDGLQAIFKSINEIEYQKLHIVVGFVNDKPLEKVLDLFPTKARYYFAKADIPRGLDAKKLKLLAESNHLKGRAYVSVRNAFQAAKRQAVAEDLILVIGSVFVVAEVL